MNSVYLPALTALSGSVIGGLTSFASAWLTQHHQDRARRLLGEKARRQKLYKQFIDEASKLYADALVHDEAELSALVSVYADQPDACRIELRRDRKGGGGRSYDHRHVFHTQQDHFRLSRTDERPRRPSVAGLQRGMPDRIAGAQ